MNGPRNEVSLAQQVAHEIDRDPSLDACQIQVESDHGVIVLRGTVPHPSARASAEQAARHVAGVRDVANDLVCTPHGTDDRSDAEIAAAVRDALEADARVPHERITTSVTGGVVTLAGRLDRWCESRAAESVAASVVEPRSVVNDLEVEECVAPKDVYAAIVDALTRHVVAEADALTIGTFRGTVTIAGEVASSAEKQVLLAAARAVPGVKAVESRVRVRSIACEPLPD